MISSSNIDNNRGTVDIKPLSYTVNKNTTYALYFNNGNTALMAIGFKNAPSKVQYNQGNIIKAASTESTAPYAPENADDVYYNDKRK